MTKVSFWDVSVEIALLELSQKLSIWIWFSIGKRLVGVEHVNLDFASREVAVNDVTDYQKVVEDLMERVYPVMKGRFKIHSTDRNVEEPNCLRMS